MSRALANGLTIHDRGVSGLIVEESNEREVAERRFQCVLDRLGSLELSAGAELLLRLPTDAAVLHVNSLSRIGQSGSTYFCPGVGYCVEWHLDRGWLDRRILPESLARVMCNARGCNFTGRHLAETSDWLAALVPSYAGAPDVFAAFVQDAWAWWFPRLTGPIFAHATRLKPFQLLSRAAFARCATGRPQKGGTEKRDRELESARSLLETTRSQSGSLKVFDAVVLEAGRISRLRGDVAHGRCSLVEFIDTRLIQAAQEGRAQLAALICTRAAITGGGISGKQWTPRTIYDYLQNKVRALVAEMCSSDIDSLEDWEWHASYKKLFDPDEASQHRKLDAFLQAFHRGMVILGFPPLPASLSQGSHQLPPAAACIDDRSFLRALTFVAARATDRRVKLQATAGLLLARHIPLRTHEIFLLRMGVVELTAPMTISVNPARGDGGAKAPATKRPPERVSDPVLQKALGALWRLRRSTDLALADQDMLFGRPGHPHERYEQERTTKLMNAALRWGTGDSLASLYDLRHTVFSARVEHVLVGA